MAGRAADVDLSNYVQPFEERHAQALTTGTLFLLLTAFGHFDCLSRSRLNSKTAAIVQSHRSPNSSTEISSECLTTNADVSSSLLDCRAIKPCKG